MTDGSGPGPETGGAPDQPPAFLLDALRELSDEGAARYAAQAEGTCDPEPLMERIERDRRRRRAGWVVSVAALALAVVACLAVGFVELASWARGVTALLRSGTVALGGPPPAVLIPFAVAAIFAGTGYLWLRPVDVRRLARAYAAHPAAAGEVPASARALDEIAPAFGLAAPPPLLVVDAPTLNAFSAGTPDAPVLAVTRALATSMPVDEQRAVFAHLLARLAIGAAPEAQGEPTIAEQADALAMQALRDPHAMLTSLERVAAADTALLPARSGFAPAAFFFAPEMPTYGVTGNVRAAVLDVRLRRLRAVLGASGAGE